MQGAGIDETLDSWGEGNLRESGGKQFGKKM